MANSGQLVAGSAPPPPIQGKLYLTVIYLTVLEYHSAIKIPHNTGFKVGRNEILSKCYNLVLYGVFSLLVGLLNGRVKTNFRLPTVLIAKQAATVPAIHSPLEL